MRALGANFEEASADRRFLQANSSTGAPNNASTGAPGSTGAPSNVSTTPAAAATVNPSSLVSA